MRLFHHGPLAAAGGLAAACGLALAAVLVASPAFSETIGTLPINYSKLKTWDYDGNDFVVHDSSTKYEWKFPSGDMTFYHLLAKLDGVAPGNIAQLAYVGNPPAEELGTAHDTWVAPLNAEQQPSMYSGNAPAAAKPFNPRALRIASAGTRGSYMLTDGNVTVADVRPGGEESSLHLLQEMIEKFGLNAAWQMTPEFERTLTPVGSAGPVIVFLRLDQTAGRAQDVAAHAPKRQPGAKKASCKGRWWSPSCW